MVSNFKYTGFVKTSIIVFILIVISISCNKKREVEQWRHVEISPLDKSQVITIITKGNKRYIMNGVHSEIPRDNYLLMDISKVDPLGDAISICWNDSGYRWKFDSTYATLIENKLDTTKFLFFKPLGRYGEPVSTGYTADNCGDVMIREYQQPGGNLKITYIPDSTDLQSVPK